MSISLRPSSAPDLDIAVIGMAGRFPGARDVAELWHNLHLGVDSISFFSDEELTAAGLDAGLLADPAFVKAGGVLEDAESFDASFFGLSPREAELMDPQHRVFLECAWEAFENAGYEPTRFGGVIGVYAGAGLNTYLLNNLASERQMEDAAAAYRLAVLNGADTLATQVSYRLNLTGPSVGIQTSCSTSLVAIHMACQALLGFECDMALAGGAAIKMPQRRGYRYQQGGILSSDGRCRPFDERAAGTVVGSAVAGVVLRRLADAIADGDAVRAVIKGSAVNNDGSRKAGFTAPSAAGQAAVIVAAQAVAQVHPDTIGYVEAHGTGTPLGDPLEIAALTQAFRAATGRRAFCAVGSLKSNVGHLDAAAGVAGLIKTVLTLEQEEIPPTAHYESPNPAIDFASSPFYVAARPTAWKRTGQPRRAGVSSFGIGGTNAHVIVEEAPLVPPAASTERRHELLVLSARSPAALDTATERLVRHLGQHPDLDPGDVAYTLQVGRKDFPHRRAIVYADVGEVTRALADSPGNVFTGFAPRAGRVASFMFPGGGAQYQRMGEDLYRLEPTFRASVDRCAEILVPHLGSDIRAALYGDADAREAEARLAGARLGLPALFVTEYALAQLLITWGLRPVAMIGHSLGEYTAACLSGVFTLEDALALVALRGQLFERLPGGAMLAVALSEGEVEPLLGERLSLAAVNGPASCVVAGLEGEIDGLEAGLAARGIDTQRLPIHVAAHSHMVAPAVGELRNFVAALRLQPPTIPFVSNLSGTWISARDATDPDYWGRHLRETVRFAKGIAHLLKDDPVLLEVGPGHGLTHLTGRRAGLGSAPTAFAAMRHAKDRRSDAAALLHAVGQCWASGVAVEWSRHHEGRQRRRVPLPTYPFARERYCIEPDLSLGARRGPPASPEARRDPVPDASVALYVPYWRRCAPLDRAPLAQAGPDATWLVFADQMGLAAVIAERLRRERQDVSLVVPPTAAQAPSASNFTIDPRRPEDYERLLRDLAAQGRRPGRILHLWSVSAGDATAPSLESFDEFQAWGYHSVIALLQALGSDGVTPPARLGMVSTDIQAVTGEERLRPEKATLLGLVPVARLEYPRLACSSIDLDSSAMRDRLDALAESVLVEMSRADDGAVVAYRGRHRWVQGFERLAPQASSLARTPIRSGGRYLVTGGLGAVGLLLAEHLAAHGASRLALLTRRAVPDRAQWPGGQVGLAAQDETASVLRRVQSLENRGVEVQIVQADVACLEQLRHAVARIRQVFGGLDGVVHAAGSAGGAMITTLDPRVEGATLASKARGGLALDVVLGDEPLDFLLFCSSLSAIAGTLGQAEYAAANAFLDGLAHARSSAARGRTIAIDWDRWEGTGMAMAAEVHHRALTGADAPSGVRPAEALAAFSRVLAESTPQVVVSPRPPEATRREGLRAAELLRTGRPLPRPRHRRPPLLTPYAPPTRESEQKIAALWEELLGIEEIGIHDSFFELGGHSLLGVQLASRIRDSLQAHVPLRVLFECPTIAALAVAVEKRQGSVQDEPALVPLPREPMPRLGALPSSSKTKKGSTE